LLHSRSSDSIEGSLSFVFSCARQMVCRVGQPAAYR
jgi:hypothetical protein